MEIKDLVAIYAAIMSTISISWNIYLERVKKGKQRKVLAGSLLAELEAIEIMYKKVELKPWDIEVPSLDIIKLDANYFAIFDGNTDKIGIFNKEDAAIIVGSYMFFKSYVDTLKVLSEEWQNVVRFRQKLPLNTQLDYDYKKRLLDDRNNELKILYKFAYGQQNDFYEKMCNAKQVFQRI